MLDASLYIQVYFAQVQKNTHTVLAIACYFSCYMFTTDNVMSLCDSVHFNYIELRSKHMAHISSQSMYCLV